MTKKSLLTIALLASLSAPTFADSFDSRSLGMGGVGVSSSDYLAAPFHNPALVAKYDETDDVGVLLPFVGVNVNNGDNIIEKLEDFSDFYDLIGFSASADDIQNVITSLEDMDGNSGKIQAGVGFSISIPNKYLSTSLFSTGFVDGFVLTSVSSDDLNIDNYSDPLYELSSRGFTAGVSVVELGVSFAHSFELENGNFYVGFSPKYQSVSTYNYSVSVENYEFDDWDSEEFKNDDKNFNADFGVAYSMKNGYTFGFVGKNLFEQTYKTVLSDDNTQVEYTLSPVYIASGSYSGKLFTLAVDVELTESKRYENIIGINSDDFSDNTQFASIGGEFNAWDWAQLRVGYQHDISGNFDDKVTAGIGLSPFDVFHIDLAGSYTDEDQYGASIQTSFTF